MLSAYTQNEKGLIASSEAIEKLATLNHARILLISDSHGNSKKFETIVRQYGAKCNALVFCGDGAVDLANLLSKSFYDEELKALIPPVIAFARGNGDPATYPVNDKFSLKIPNSQILCVNHQNILIVHGHRQSVDFSMENLGLEMQISDCKTAFYGHTHIASEEIQGEYKFVNPGSCSFPRGGQCPSFAIATVENTFIDIAFIKMILKTDGSYSYEFWTPPF